MIKTITSLRMTNLIRTFLLAFGCLLFTINMNAQVTVNPGAGSYGTVNAAFAAINAGTHTGAVTIAIATSTTEPAAPTVLASSGVGAANYSSITIYPTAANVVVAGTSSGSRGVLEFNGADNITINGNINNGVGSSRNLTIQNNTANTNIHAVLWFQSSATAPSLGCTDIIVKNVILIGNANVSLTRTATTPFQPAVAFSSTVFPTSATTVTAVNNSNITFDNNEILRSFGGLHIGQFTTSALSGLIIRNNTFGSAIAADYCIYRAMYISNCSGALIEGNTLTNIRSTIASSSGAIELAGATGANNIVRKNLISGVSNINTGGWACAGIYVITGNNNTTIDNNVIYDLQGANYASVTTTFNAYGIRLAAGTGHKVYFNSVNLYGTINSGTTPSTSTAIAVGATTVTGLDIRNNIFSNLHVSTVNGYQAFCIRYASGYPFSTSGNIVNNNYYSVPSANTATTSYFLGGTYAAGVTFVNLAALQAATGQDAQSHPIINIPAPFTADNNLVIPASTSTSIESGGVVIAALGLPNTDFNGVNRPAGSGTAPDMGAYEFEGIAATGCTGTPAAGGTASTTGASICAGNSTSLTASGYTSDIGIEYNWQSGSAVGGPFTDIVGANSPSTYNTQVLSANTYYRLRVTCTNSSLSVYSNVVTITVNNPQIVSTNSPQNLCGIGTVTFNANVSSGSTANWYAAPSGGTPIFTGTSFTTPVISSSTNYYVAATSGGTTFNTSKLAPETAGTGTNLNTYGQDFTVTTGFTLNSVQVFSTTGTSITVALYSSGGTTQLLTTGPVAVTAGTSPNINLGWAIGPGTYRLCVPGMTGNFIRDNSGVTYPFALTGIGTMNGFVSAITGSVTTSSSYYFVYNWSVSTGCESPRQMVAASVVSAPTVSASTTKALVCSGGLTTLNATSTNDPDYTYTWTSNPAGFNASGSSVSANPAVNTTYTVTALDNTAGQYGGCTTFTTVNVTAQPASATVSGSPESICASSGSTVVGLLPASGYPAGSIQWQSSPTGSGYTDIGGATGNTYSTGTISSSTFYRALIKDGDGTVCISPFKEIIVGVPTVNSTTPNTRCGTGTTTLQATGSAGSSIVWYASSTGGLPIGTGSPFTTPVITSSTNYYAAASNGSTTTTTGMTNAITSTSSGSGTTNFGLVFDALSSFTLYSVKLYPVSATSASGTVTIDVINGSGTVVHTATVNVTGSPSGSVIPQTVVLNFNIAAGTNYKLRPGNITGISGLLFEPSAGAPSGNYGYPYVVPGVLSINTSTLTIAPTNTARNDLYYYFYNWTVSTGCEGSRTLVTATVTPAPPITAATTAAAICPGGSADLSVTSSNDPSYTYVWTSIPAGYNATGAGPHTVSPSVTTKYFVTATDNSGGANNNCSMIDSVTVINGGTLVAGTVSASQSSLCISGTSLLTLTGASGGANQWQSSTVSATGPWTNVGTGANTYNPGTITQTTYYQVVTSCNSSSLTSNVQTITVNNPTLTSTTPATRCGAGTVTLSATTTANSVYWYATASGGTPIATTNSFTTPVISNTTNYWASAVSGGGSGSIGPVSPTAQGGVISSSSVDWDMQFNVLTATTLQTVDIFPTAAIGSSGSVKITTSAGVLIADVPYTTTVSGGTTAQTVTLNVPLAPGTGYKIRQGTAIALNRNTSGQTYPISSSTIVITGNGFDQTYYYYYYRWTFSSGCESARTLVAATVTPPPAINLVAGDAGLCTGGSTTLTVSSSNDPNYTYTWTSVPAGFNQTGNGPFTISPTVTTKYFVNAIDNSAGPNNSCVISDSVNITVTGTLTAGTVSSSIDTICVSGSPTLTLTGSEGAIQWQSSTISSSGPWNNVGAGQLNFTPFSPISQTTYYQAVVSCQASSLTSNVVTVVVNNPQITSTAPNSRCGAGTVNLGATASSGASVNWYSSPSGGSPLGSGTTFTTPVINSNTNFYAAANNGFTSFSNTVGYSTSANYNFITQSPSWGLMFTANQACSFDSVAVFPTGTGTISIKVLDVNNNILFNGPTVNISGVNGLPKVFVPIGATLAPGNYKIGMVYTGITNLGSQPTGGPFAYPFVSSIATITSGTQGSGAVAGVYYWFYDLSFSASQGCEGPRVPVLATVTAAPAITASSNFTTPCAGNPVQLSVSSSNANYTYSWTSNPAGFTGTGAGPLTANPTVATTYQVYANDNSGGAFNGCGALSSVIVSPTSNPLSLAVTASPTTACPGDNVQLNAVATVASGIAGYNFVSSTSSYTPISGGTVLTSAAWDDSGPGLAVPLGFTFNFNGVNYTTCNINLNGYISFGTTTTTTNYTPISTLVANEVGIVAPFARDIQGQTATGEIRYTSSGGVFTVQWTDARRYNGTTANTEAFSFQLKLVQSGNQIKFVYGNFSDAQSATTTNLPQVGLRGATITDFRNLEILSTGNWSTPTLGTSNTQTGYYNQTTAATKPASGLTYTFSPPIVGGLTYDWSANPTYLSATNIINPIAQAMISSQTYSVTITDGSTGCTKTETKIVDVNPLPQPTASSNSPVCEGQSVSFFGNNSASGQTSGNGYSWSGPNGFNDIVQNPTLSNASAAASGTYTVTVTNQFGCSETTTTQVTVAPLPALNILSQTNVSCNGGSDGAFTIEVTNGSGFYLYDQNGNINFDGNFTGFSAGTYIVQVTDGNSCASSIPVTITEPDPTTTADAGVDQSACSGSTVTLAGNTAVVGTGSWSLISGSGTFTNDTDPATTVTGIGFGLNTYRWTIDNALCFNSNFDDVTVTGTDLPTAIISGTQEICIGGTANLSFSFTGTAPWSYSVNGGAPVSTSTSPEIVSVTPGTTTVYTITSLSDASCTGSGTGSATVTVTQAPPASSSNITSLPADACVGSTVVVSTNVVLGATSYTWSAPAGTLINGLPSPQTVSTNTVSLTLGALPANSSSWLICVFASNACGNTNTNCKYIRGSLSTPGAISGSTVSCPNTGPSTYTTTAVTGASSYLWSITGDASVTGTGLTGSVTFGPTFTTGSLCVRALLPCGYQGPTRCMSIANGTPLLGAMIGTFAVCPGSNGVAYSVPPSAGATTYNWTVPAGATIASGAGTNSITINFGPTYTNGNVCVIATSVCGINSLPRCKTVGSDKPGTPGNFTTGALTGVCGQTITYNVNSVSGATGYTWTAPAGATIASANGTNTIDISFSNSFTTGNVCVTADNGCGSGTPRCVLVKATPSNPGVITGTNSVCAFDAGISYSVSPVFGATGYVWTIPSGAAIVSGQGTTSIIVDYGTSGGVIGVTATGTCGNSGTRTLAVAMNCKLSSSVIPDASINAYPNPVSSNLTVELKTNNSGTYTVELLDLSGRIVKSEVMNAVTGLNRNSMDVSTLAKGMYMLNVKNENGFAQQLRIAVE